MMQALTGVRHVPGRDDGALELYTPRGWSRHPVALMWRDHLSWLLEYQIDVCAEWTSRTTVRGVPYRDTCMRKTLRVFNVAVEQDLVPIVSRRPSWLGDDAFHRSHRSNLLRKLPEHYGPLFDDVPNDLPYVWPGAA